MKANRIGTWLILGGLLLVAAALLLAGYNLREEVQAADAASDALQQILSEVRPQEEAVQSTESDQQDNLANEETIPSLDIPAYLRDPNMEMPTAQINGQDYIGVVEIPALELSLPVISEWSYPRLKIAPCRYQGSAYLNDLIIMAHNYKSHFGTLLSLKIGDTVYFTDMDENVFAYEVVELETLGGTDVEEMTTGDWDLTLFTCTVGGKTRVTVRCVRTQS